MTKDTEADRTKLAVIANTLTFIQKDIGEIKTDVKDMRAAYLPMQDFTAFKMDHDHAIANLVTKQELSNVTSELVAFKDWFKWGTRALIVQTLALFAGIIIWYIQNH